MSRESTGKCEGAYGSEKQELDRIQPATASTERKLESPGRFPETSQILTESFSGSERDQGRKVKETLRHHLRHDQKLDYIDGNGGQSDSGSVLN